LPAGWSSLGLRVEAGGDGPALRARIEDEADPARDRIDLLLAHDRWSQARAEIEEQARIRSGRAAGILIGSSGPPDSGRAGCGAKASPRAQTLPNEWRRSGRTA